MEVITKRSAVEALDAPLSHRPVIFDRPRELTFYERVEMVAEGLTDAVLNGAIEAKTEENPVHAYVEAHYVTPRLLEFQAALRQITYSSVTFGLVSEV